MSVSEIGRQLEREDNDLKLRAVSSEFRRLLLSLIYTDGPIYHSDILKHIEVTSNVLAYHLNILDEADLVERTFDRHGRTSMKYSITEDGEKFLEFIGAKEGLKHISNRNTTM